MDVSISGRAEQILRSQVRSGRFASEQEAIEEAVRRLEGEPAPATSDDSTTAFLELQRSLFADGLLNEIRPPERVDTGTERFVPIVIDGEPLSETIIRRERR